MQCPVHSFEVRLQTHVIVLPICNPTTYRGADKSLARPRRKKATATKTLTFTSHSKKKFRRLSVQPGLRVSNDLRVGRKTATFQFFFSRIGLRTYQHPCTYFKTSQFPV